MGQGLKSAVRYDARDSIRYDARTQTVYLYGAATVKYEDLDLTADRILYSFKNEEAQAFGAPDSSGVVAGKPVFHQGAQEIQADTIRYNFRTKEGYVKQARTQEQESWVQANASKLHANGEVHSKGGMLTTCDRPKPHYHFKVSRMIVIPDDKIVAGPAYMKIGKVPTPLAVPFGIFPNKPRGAAGILVPTWGESEQLGYFLLNGGYYLPLGDRADLRLTGDVYSRGSWALNAVTRYRTRYRYAGSLDLKHNTLLNSDPEFPDFSRQRTFFVRWDHRVDAKASLYDRFNASVNVGSTNNFTNNLNSSTGDYLTNTFQSNIAWTHLFPWLVPSSLGVNLRHSQNSQTGRFDFTLPSVAFNMNRFFPVELFNPKRTTRLKWYENWGITNSVTFDNRVSTSEQRLYWANLPVLAREAQNGVRLTSALSTSLKTTYFTLNPEMRFTDRVYFKTLRKTYDAGESAVVTDTITGFANTYEYSAGATLTSKLFGMFQFRGEKLKAIRHVITPSVGFNYRPDFSTQRELYFGDSLVADYSPYDIGIYGKPSAGESGLLSLGLIQSLEAKVRDAKADTTGIANGNATKKIKLIDVFSMNSAYDLMKDSLHWSPVGMAARTVFFNRVNLNLNAVFDPYAVDSFGVRYEASELRTHDRLARLTSANAAVGFEVKSRKYGQGTSSQPDNDPVVGEADPSKGARLSFSMPWRMNVNYSYDVLRAWAGDAHTDDDRQSVLVNGDVTVFKHWKLGASSGWDITNEDWTPTSLNLYWDLHCWEFNFNIIPIGVRRSYTFRINVKASILRDLKYERVKPIGGDGELLY